MNPQRRADRETGIGHQHRPAAEAELAEPCSPPRSTTLA